MKRALVLVAALSIVMIGCGDDDDADGAGPTIVAGGTVVGADAPTADGTTAADSGYCTALAAFKTARDEFAAAVASGTATPEQLETAITNQGSAFMALVDTAPADIAGDMSALAGPMDSYIEALAEVDYDVASLTTANAAAAEALNQFLGPDYIEATLSVDAYGLENCGITIGDWQAVVP